LSRIIFDLKRCFFSIIDLYERSPSTHDCWHQGGGLNKLTVNYLLQAAHAAANDDDVYEEDAMKLSASVSKKTVVTTKMVQRWSNTLSVSLVTLLVVII